MVCTYLPTYTRDRSTLITPPPNTTPQVYDAQGRPLLRARPPPPPPPPPSQAKAAEPQPQEKGPLGWDAAWEATRATLPLPAAGPGTAEGKGRGKAKAAATARQKKEKGPADAAAR